MLRGKSKKYIIVHRNINFYRLCHSRPVSGYGAGSSGNPDSWMPASAGMTKLLKNLRYSALVGIISLVFFVGFILPAEPMGDWIIVPSPLTPVIDSISPNPAKKGLEEVTLIGHCTEISGVTIAGYKWTSSIDGVLSTEATFKISTLSKGEHTIFFGGSR